MNNRHEKSAICKFCGADIVWISLQSRKPICVDATYKAGFVKLGERYALKQFRESHFATCAHADKARRNLKPPEDPTPDLFAQAKPETPIEDPDDGVKYPDVIMQTEEPVRRSLLKACWRAKLRLFEMKVLDPVSWRHLLCGDFNAKKPTDMQHVALAVFTNQLEKMVKDAEAAQRAQTIDYRDPGDPI